MKLEISPTIVNLIDQLTRAQDEVCTQHPKCHECPFGDYELSRVDADEWILYRNRVVHYELRDVTSALELIRMVKK